jgi:hypothetical protein
MPTSGHINPVAIVKTEPREIKPDVPSSLLPPWAVQVVQKRKQGRAPRRRSASGPSTRVIEPVIPKDEAPWQRDGPAYPGGTKRDPPAPEEPVVKQKLGGGMRAWKPPNTAGRGTKANQALASTVQLCSRNYAAVDAKRESYGLIDQGTVDAGTRTMVMHVKRRQTAWDVLNVVKPGSILAAKSRSGRGSPTPLRVRFTTPNKYYSPGCKVTSMTIGIDEADWQSLMAKARRI